MYLQKVQLDRSFKRVRVTMCQCDTKHHYPQTGTACACACMHNGGRTGEQPVVFCSPSHKAIVHRRVINPYMTKAHRACGESMTHQRYISENLREALCKSGPRRIGHLPRKVSTARRPRWRRPGFAMQLSSATSRAVHTTRSAGRRRGGKEGGGRMRGLSSSSRAHARPWLAHADSRGQ